MALVNLTSHDLGGLSTRRLWSRKMLKLYHSPRSRSSRFIWLLEEIGAPYEIEYTSIRRVDTGTTSDPKNPHPHKLVPALEHDGRLVTESSAIALYLSDAFPEAKVGPQVGDPGRGEYVSWLAYYSGQIEPSRVALGAGWEMPPWPVGWAPFPQIEEHLAAQFRKGPWFLGDQFSTLDILLASLIQYASDAFPPRPEYTAYFERVSARPAFGRAWAKDQPPE